MPDKSKFRIGFLDKLSEKVHSLLLPELSSMTQCSMQ